MDPAKENDKAGMGTRAVWSGERGERWAGATQVPVALSVSFGYETVEEWLEVALGKKAGHIYGRNTNPTVAAFEEKVRDLEGAEAATSFASGMAAISNTLFTLLSPGDRVVSINDTYGGTNKLFIEFLPRFQIQVKLCDTTDHAAIEAEIGDMLFSMVNLARKLKVNPEDALRTSIAKFTRRFAFIEDTLLSQGRTLHDSSLDEMDGLWNEAKRQNV
jgi:cystathionine beta-lyase/cystathionine gamma-synthase